MNDVGLYNKSKSLQWQDAEDVLDSYMPLMKWKPGQTSIDVGCGDGDITINLLKKRMPSDHGVLMAVDNSSQMLKYASENYHDKDVIYKLMDIELSEVPAEHHDAYDHLFSFSVFHWIRDQMSAFKNVYKLLRNNGDFLLEMPATHHIFDSYKVLSQYPQWKEYMSDYKNRLSPYDGSLDMVADLKNILEHVGFENIRVEQVYKKHKFDGVNGLRATAAAVNPFLKKMPPHLHQVYLDDYIDYLKKIGIVGKNPDEVGEYTHSVLMVYGVKILKNNAKI